MKIQWFGHSAFEITSDDTKILIDPFISNNPVCSTAVEKFTLTSSVTHATHPWVIHEIADRSGPS